MYKVRNTIGLLTVGAFAAVLAAGPAAAQSDSFSGPYVTAIAGWDRLQADRRHDDGFLYGLNGGYDFAGGSLRFGPVFEVTGSTQKGCVTRMDSTRCYDAGRDFYVGGRVGVTVSPSALVYVGAGYTNARYTETVETGTTRIRNDRDHSGARVGAGVEYAVSDGLFVKAEYRYSNYSDDIARNQVVGGIGFRF